MSRLLRGPPTRSLHIFGDSYSCDYPWIPENKKNWMYHKILADYLNLEYYNYSVIGSSLEHMFIQFDTNKEKIKENDIVIICITSLNRTFFFEEKPWIKEYDEYCMDEISDTEAIAMKYFFSFLSTQNWHNMLVHLANFLHSVNNLASQLQNKILIIDCLGYFRGKAPFNSLEERYENLIIPNGVLHDISLGESTNLSLIQEVFKRHGGDGRLNHICKNNHDVLAGKIIDYYEKNKEIDFKGFHTNIFSNIEYYELDYSNQKNWPVY